MPDNDAYFSALNLIGQKVGRSKEPENVPDDGKYRAILEIVERRKKRKLQQATSTEAALSDPVTQDTPEKEMLEIQHDLGVLVKHLDAYDDKDAVLVPRSVPAMQEGMLEHVALIRAAGEKHSARRRWRRRSYYYLLQAWTIFAVGAVMLIEWGSSIPRDSTGLGFLVACLLVIVLIPLWVILWDGRDYTSQHQDLLKIVESADNLQNMPPTKPVPPPHPEGNIRSLRQLKGLAENLHTRLASTLRQPQALPAPKEQPKPLKNDFGSSAHVPERRGVRVTYE